MPRTGPGSAPRSLPRCSVRSTGVTRATPASCPVRSRRLSRAEDHGGGRVRPDVLAGEVGLRAVGDRPPPVMTARSRPPTTRPSPTPWPGSEAPRCLHPPRHATASDRSTSTASWRPRSPTATPAPATPTCTPTSRSRTRSRPWTGKWLVLDGRILHKLAVTASERPTTPPWRSTCAPASGWSSRERPGTDRGKRPVREVVGVDLALNRRWSSRRASIEARRGELATAFQGDHGRPPTVVEAILLAQQATLETRDAKHEPRTLTEQRAAWREQAEEVLGGPRGVSFMVATALSARPRGTRDIGGCGVGAGHRRRGSATRSRRAARPGRSGTCAPRHTARCAPRTCPPNTSTPSWTWSPTTPLTRASIRLTPATDGIEEPPELRRADGVQRVRGRRLRDLHQHRDPGRRAAPRRRRRHHRPAPRQP